MLKLSLEIHDTNKDAQMRARAAVAMLHHIFGDAVLPYPTASVRVGEVEVKGPADKVLRELDPAPASGGRFDPNYPGRDFSAPSARGQGTDAPAPDGYPTEEPNAAAAFGTPAAAPTGERDKDGIPWDERIHASTKTTNKDGTWTRRRNTPDETFDAVMAELKQANTQRTLEAAQGMVPTPPAPSAPAVAPSVPLPPPPASAPTTVPPAPSPTPAAAPALPSAPASAGNVAPFPAIMVKVTTAQRDGKLDKPTLDSFLAAAGVMPDANGGYSILGLSRNPELIPVFEQFLNAHLG